MKCCYLIDNFYDNKAMLKINYKNEKEKFQLWISLSKNLLIEGDYIPSIITVAVGYELIFVYDKNIW